MTTTKEAVKTKATEGQTPIKFFGEADINQHGDFSSTFPAFYSIVELEEMRQDVKDMKRALDSGQVEPKDIGEAKAKYARMEGQLQKIEDSIPNLSLGEKDRCLKEYTYLTGKIKALTYTRAESESGQVEGHQENARLSKPCIPLSKEGSMFADSCGIKKVVNNMISRKDAEVIWKILGRVLELSSNTGSLQKPTGSSKRVYS